MKFLNRQLFGYDFFISYSRKDSTIYVTNLANKIIEAGYTCYIDRWGSQVGKKLPKSLIRKLTSSSVLIVLGSEHSLDSQAIADEIDFFLKTKKTIIAIDFGNIENAGWYSKIEGIAISKENSKKTPSEYIVNTLISSFNYTKQSKRILYSATVALLLIISSIVGIAYNSNKIKNQEDLIRKNILVIDSKNDSLKKVSDSLSLLNDSIILKNEKFNRKSFELDSINKIFESTKELLDDNYEISQQRTKEILKTFKKIQNIMRGRIRSRYINNLNLLVDNNEVVFTIFYDFDKSSLNNRTVEDLIMLSAFLKRNKNLSIQISSHFNKFYYNKEEWEYMESMESVDKKNNESKKLIGVPKLNRQSSKAYAINLSSRHSRSIADFLINSGIPHERIISAIGFGYDKMDFDDEIYNFTGNRVEIKILTK